MAAVLPPRSGVDIPPSTQLLPNATPQSPQTPSTASSISSAAPLQRPGFFRIVYHSFIGIFVGIYNFFKITSSALISFVTRLFLALCGRQQRTAPTPISLYSSSQPRNFTRDEVKAFLTEEIEWARSNPPPPDPVVVVRVSNATGQVPNIALDPNRFNGITINENELGSAPPPPDEQELTRNIAGQNIEIVQLLQEFDSIKGYVVVPGARGRAEEIILLNGVPISDNAREKREGLKSYIAFLRARTNRSSYSPQLSREYFDLLHLYVKNSILVLRNERNKENEQIRLTHAGRRAEAAQINILAKEVRETVLDELCRASQNCDPDITNETERQWLSLKGGFANSLQLSGSLIRTQVLTDIRDLKEDLLGIELYCSSEDSNHNHAVNTLNYIRRTVGHAIGLNTGSVNINDPYALRNMFLPIRRGTGQRHVHPKQIFREFLKVYLPRRIIPALMEKNNRKGAVHIRPFLMYIGTLFENEVAQNRLTEAASEAWLRELFDGDPVDFTVDPFFSEKGIEFLLVHLRILNQAPEIARRIPLIDPVVLQPPPPSVTPNPTPQQDVPQPVVTPEVPPVNPQPPQVVVVNPPVTPVINTPVPPPAPIVQPVIQPVIQPVVVQPIIIPAAPLGIEQWTNMANQVAEVRRQLTARPITRVAPDDIPSDLPQEVVQQMQIINRLRTLNDDGARHHAALIRTHYLTLTDAQRNAYQGMINTRAPELFDQQARMFIALDMIAPQNRVYRPRYATAMAIELDVLRIEYMTMSDAEKAQFVASVYSTVRPTIANSAALWDSYQQTARLLANGNMAFIASVQTAVINL